MQIQSLRKIIIATTMGFALCCVTSCADNKKHEATVSLALDSLSWNITKNERAAILKSPDAVAQLTYLPDLAIPGIDAHWKRCGILMLPCIDADEETTFISASQVDAATGKLVFTVPLLSTKRHFPLKQIDIVLPFYRWPDGIRSYESEARISLGITRDEKEGHRMLPAWFSNQHRALAGTVTFTATDNLLLTTNWPSPLISKSWNPPYTFYYPYSRFAGYRQGNMSFPIKKTLRPPYPPELVGLKEIYNSWFDSGEVDGHRIERVDISGEQNERPDECILTEISYQALLVDSKVIHYSENVSDPHENGCVQRRREIDFDDSGQVVSYADYRVRMTNSGSGVDYSEWSSLCQTNRQHDDSKCTHAEPTAGEIDALVAAAKHVSEWFATSPAESASSPP